MSTSWWWIRHGPTHAKGFVGWADLPADLSDVRALARLRGALPAGALVVSSDLSRAVATADILAGGRERLPHDPDLREIAFGDWEELTAADVTARDGALARRYWEEPGDIAPPGGESWNALSGRVGAAVERLGQLHRGRDMIAVAHFGVILSEVQRARGVSAQTAFGQAIAPLSLTRITLGDDGSRQEICANLLL